MLSFDFDNQFNKNIIGVDEVGRGPLAGPVVAAACHFINSNSKEIDIRLFNDSKKLSHNKREECFKHILYLKKKSLVKFQIGESTVKEIDLLNILQASLLAMKRAVQGLSIENALVLIDGIHSPKLDTKLKTIIKGDQKSLSIAAASIIAKVHRDKIMKKLSKSFPQYGWEKNMGYGTIKHMNGIKLTGVTKFHRKTFKPVKKFIQNNL